MDQNLRPNLKSVVWYSPEYSASILATSRRGSTPVSTVLGNGQIFHNKYIFDKRLSTLKSRDEIIRRFARLHPRRMELANIVSEWLNGDFRELKSQIPKHSRGSMPPDPLETCAFCARSYRSEWWFCVSLLQECQSYFFFFILNTLSF